MSQTIELATLRCCRGRAIILILIFHHSYTFMISVSNVYGKVKYRLCALFTVLLLIAFKIIFMVKINNKMNVKVKVNSPKVNYSDHFIETRYEYHTTQVEQCGNVVEAIPKVAVIDIKTSTDVPKLGLMLVGWGGNNGSTLSAALLANKRKLSWETREGKQAANWYGSITQSSTISLGTHSTTGEPVYVPMKSLLPMVSPDDIVVDGWDLSKADISQAAKRAGVLQPPLLEQLQEDLVKMKPRKSIYDPKFIAQNQVTRVDNAISTENKMEQVQQIISDINDFKRSNNVDCVIVVWTANTERYSKILTGVNDTLRNLKASIEAGHDEISPSTLFAYAAIETGCIFINGSPQNTFVPAIIEFAEKRNVFVAGDDFKTGQTKVKSVLVDFLVSAGIKPASIVSYNHLGNNDGRNLSAPDQFRSKELSKSNVVDDIISSNPILYSNGDKPDHCVVIKYVPYVGDSKRAMDEYISEIMMGGHNTLVLHNTCEDSLLAVPIILDLVILAELCSRITFCSTNDKQYSSFHPILSILAYMCKAPLVPNSSPVINALFKQRSCIDNILRACIGIPPENNMLLEHKILALMNKNNKQTN